MTATVRVFQTTIVAKQPGGEESVLVSCRSLDGVYQVSFQATVDSAPMVGDIFQLSLSASPGLGERIGS